MRREGRRPRGRGGGGASVKDGGRGDLQWSQRGVAAAAAVDTETAGGSSRGGSGSDSV